MKKIRAITALLAFVAHGTEFNSKEECQKYEDTAKCALFARYKPLVKSTASEYDIFKTGGDDYLVDIVHIYDESDIDTIIQLDALSNPHRGNIDNYYADLRNKLDKCLHENDFILIGRGTEYEHCDNFYPFITLQEIVNNIKG